VPNIRSTLLGEAIAVTLCCAVVALFAGTARASDVPENSTTEQDRIKVAGPIASWTSRTTAPANAPNVLLILLDDVGYAAASTFGGAVQTPGMDRLAASGLRYNNFHVTALCSPTRAALLSGRNDHRIGFGTVMESARRTPGYDGVWRKDAASIAKVLQLNGYRTAAFGKWHNTPYFEISPAGPFDRWPTGLGFDHFYGFMAGAMDHFYPALYLNTSPIDPPRSGADGYNLGSDITDQAIAWMNTHDALAADQPWLIYYSTGATHEPFQPPKEWIKKYRGRFDKGWDVLRAETFARQKKLGFIPANAELTPRPKELPEWRGLSPQQQRLYARQMEVFAAYLAYTDYEVDRLIGAVRTAPNGDNTLVVYVVSDNGASGEAGPDGKDLMGLGAARATVDERVARLEDIGDLPSAHYSAGWAWATSSPFKWMKQVGSHLGGTTSPLIVSWPAHIKDRGGLRQQFTHVNSVAATIYELIGIAPPKAVEGVEQLPLDGVSFAYTITQPNAPSRHPSQIFEQMGNRAIYHDGWWAAARHAVPWDFHRSEDFAQDRWELYYLSQDFSQAHDLSAQQPQKLRELQALFEQEASANHVFPLHNSFGKNGFGGEQPRLFDGRKEFVFRPDVPRMPASQAPDFNRSHRIVAQIDVPEGGAEGTLLANGGRLGGFALYVQAKHLVYEHNYRARRSQQLRSTRPLPSGAVEVAYEYTASVDAPTHGQGRLYVNGELVAEAEVPYFEAPTFTSEFSVFTIGRAPPVPIVDSIRGAFPFTGRLDRVNVTLR